MQLVLTCGHQAQAKKTPTMMSQIGKNEQLPMGTNCILSLPCFRASVRPHHPTRSRLGFTLIEVLISVVILSAGIVLVLRALDASIIHLSISRDTLIAAALITDKIAETEGFALSPDGINPGISGGRFIGAYRGFRWEQRVKEVDGLTDIYSSDLGLKHTLHEVCLSVWHEDSSRRYSATTFIRTTKKLKNEISVIK